jgi:L-phenylalanine/L-methionine N-acetyltransferase
MNALEIRHVEKADIPQLQALYAEPGAYANTLQLPYPAADDWEQRMAPKEGRTGLVAIRGEEVVGHLVVEVFQRPRRRHVATLGMAVKASARRSGVGSALLNAAVELCDKWFDVTRIELEVYTDNDAAIELYGKHGFVTEGTCRRYAYRDGEYVDAHIMARLRSSGGARP